ncbi:MAG: isopentenyl-diphosphate Delta-isomerase [Acutalibacteraceae bacterium]
MNDELILVNLNDEPIGHLDKTQTHRTAQLHRAFSVFLYKIVDKKIYMLLQKRAEDKYHSGGLWTNACCSHPRTGETLQEAVPRRMKEELGISTPVREVFSFTYFHRFSQTCAEFEYDHVFIGEWEEQVNPDPQEIAQTAWVEISELERQMTQNPDSFTAWFMIAAPKVNQLLRAEACR